MSFQLIKAITENILKKELIDAFILKICLQQQLTI